MNCVAASRIRRGIWIGLLVIAALAWLAPLRLEGQAAARPLVRGAVDESERVTLAGNRHPLAQARFDRGRVEDEFAAGGLYLVLKRPPEREEALRQFLEDVQTPGSASYHQWVSPEAFGERFGVADSDVAAISSWLQSHGLAVDRVQRGRMALRFSGTAAQLREAFRTEIHSYSVAGKMGETGKIGEIVKTGEIGNTIYANASDPEIPAAFADVIAGVSPMASVHARPLISVAGRTSYNAKTHAATAEWTYPASATPYVFELGPGDFAMQYGLTSVYAAGTTGSGQSIGVVSDSNVDLSLFQAYQTLFGLPASVPSVVIDGNDPGQNEDATETYLDLEEAGAVAPGANLILYTSAGTLLGDPLLAAALRAVEDNQVSVLSVSYAACEASLGVGGNAAWATLWQEAAAQGMSVFVAAGDSGSAGCDYPETESFAETGLAVNGLASTPYNAAVGGTDFYYSSYATGGSALATQLASYWNTTASTAPAVSLLQPVPEQVWNDPFGLNAADGGLYSPAASSLLAGGGGSSSASLLGSTGALVGYPKPNWQAGAGVSNDGVRDVPDVALFAGDGQNYVYYPICAQPGDCGTPNTAGAVTVTSVGGTSAAAPAMAAIQALVDQSMKGRQGLAAAYLYGLATKFGTATVKPFNDVHTGGNQGPCFAGTLNCVLGTSGQTKGFYAESGYASGTGFDRASGLGSVNVAALIADWPSYTFRPTTTTLTVTPSSFAHGTAATVAIAVTPTGASGTPTGGAALKSSSTLAYSNGLGAFALANGAASATINNLPGGTYQVTAGYTGDATYAPSNSAPVTLTVTQETDSLNTSAWTLNPLDNQIYPLTSGLSIPYGAEVYFDAQPVGVNEAASTLTQNTPATGSVIFTDTQGTGSRNAISPLNGAGVAEWVPGAGAVGTHSVSASYAGDASYAASTTASAIGYTVFKGTTTLNVYPLETSVAAGGTVTVDVEMYSQYLPLVGTLPTGNVTVTLGNKTQTAAWSSWGTLGSAVEEAVVTFTGVPAGLLPLMATYAGDTNWYGSSSLYGTVHAVATKSAPAVTLTAATTAYTPSQMVTMTGTVTGPTAGAAPSGNLNFTWADGTESYAGPLSAIASNASAFTLAIPASMLANGTNLFVATFPGDANYSAQSSAPLAIALTESDFSAVATTQEVSVPYGTKGTGTVVVYPVNGFNSPVTVSCSALAGITCTPASTPITIGTRFAEAITITIPATIAAGTFPATVTLTGGGHTHSVQILVATTPPAPAPVFAPPAGTYATAQTVTISDAASGATIYYTTNGTTPTTASAVYTTPIQVTATETIKALASAVGYQAGTVGTATYTIAPAAATPVLSAPTGKYTSTQTVTISDATVGATIYYTTDGSTPTTAATPYTGAISVATSETLKAAAIAAGYSLSAVASAIYVITPIPAAPVFSPAAGTYATAQLVTISDTSAGASIYYTTNGASPTTGSTLYTGPVNVAATETIKAFAIAGGYSVGSQTWAAYTITPPVAATPTFSPAAGTYTQTQMVTISDTTAGATIYYTTNGTTPTTASAQYGGPISVTSTETIEAMAIATGYSQSATATAAYTITSAAAPPPVTHLPKPGTPLPIR